MDNETLKPCPFCGGQAHVWMRRIADYDDKGNEYRAKTLWAVNARHRAFCILASTMQEDPLYITHAQAVEAWNRRDHGV